MDYSVYDLLTEFTLIQAACAWNEVTAMNPENKQKVEMVFHELIRAIESNELPVKKRLRWKLTNFITTQGHHEDDWPNSTVTKIDLIAWAEKRGKRPAFLFPEKRKELSIDSNKITKPHGNKEVNATKREEVLGAALSVLKAYPDKCTDGAKIRKMIDEKSLIFWPSASEPPLSSDVIERLVNDWIGKLK